MRTSARQSTFEVTNADLSGLALMMRPWLELLRRLALSDEGAMDAVLRGRLAAPSPLDGKTDALVRMAALVALGAGGTWYQWAVDAAHAAGADDEEIVDVLFAMAPAVGWDTVTEAAPAIALALGHEFDDC